jgi:hypothetical protein
MTERQRGLVLLAVAVIGCVAIIRANDDVPFQFVLVVLVLVRLLLGTYRAREGRNALSQILATLRSQDRAGRQAILERIPSPRLRGYLEEVLRSDGSEEREGDVEHFPYPRSLQRRWARSYWLATIAGGAALLWAAIATELPSLWRLAAIISGVLGVASAWWSSKRQRAFASVIEITPFRLTERAADGTSRTLLFNRYLELHNDPRKQCAILTAGGPDGAILLDYRRMAFNRLASLVMQYGGFQPDESAAQPSGDGG